MLAEKREKKFKELFPEEKTFRWKQAESGLFSTLFSNWEEISNLAKILRINLSKNLPWMSLAEEKLEINKDKSVFKALLKTTDNYFIETVLMKNSKDTWSICVSSQIGCPMNCLFCATGHFGFIRNLISDEIIDQYRYWQYLLPKYKELPQEITNMVYMGMGEPLLNYEEVKESLNKIIKYTKIGQTKITLSTAVVFPILEKILEDKDWPDIRIAISLHQTEEVARKKIMPSTVTDFFPKLKEWIKKYQQKYGNRNHHLTFEYILLKNLTDGETSAHRLGKLASSLGRIKINLIPYNATNTQLEGISNFEILKFQEIVKNYGILTTIRKSLGEEISAACGQLSGKKN